MTRPTNPLILHGCPIHPGGGRAPVEAIAIDGDRIVATGSLGEVRAAVGGAAYEKQLSGGALLPAFADPHQHAFLVAADPNVDVLHGCADIPDPVSYTHLDVYKRQTHTRRSRRPKNSRQPW